MATVTLDYVPMLDGEPYDPAPNGGGVDMLRLYTDQARETAPIVEAGPASIVEPGRYRFAFTAPADGTYYAVVEWRETDTSASFLDANDVLTFPLPAGPEAAPPGLVVPVDVVARRAGFPLPLIPVVREAILDAISDAQSDVEAYLGQPVVPTQRTATGLWPNPAGWAIPEPYISIVSSSPEFGEPDASGVRWPTGLYTVVYLTGLDAVNDPALRPIRRYIAAHAAALARQSPVAMLAKVKRSIKSVSVDGQGITYGDEIGVANAKDAGSGAVGTLPVLESLSRWRRIEVFQRDVVPNTRQSRHDRYYGADDGPWY